MFGIDPGRCARLGPCAASGTSPSERLDSSRDRCVGAWPNSQCLAHFRLRGVLVAPPGAPLRRCGAVRQRVGVGRARQGHFDDPDEPVRRPSAGRHAVLPDLHRTRRSGGHHRRVGVVPVRLHVPVRGDEQRLRLDGTGLGWFCLFVAVAAVVYSWWNFSGYASWPPTITDVATCWASCGPSGRCCGSCSCSCSARARRELTRFTGAWCAQGIYTGLVPAVVLLNIPKRVDAAAFAVVRSPAVIRGLPL